MGEGNFASPSTLEDLGWSSQSVGVLLREINMSILKIGLLTRPKFKPSIPKQKHGLFPKSLLSCK
jgi:hypothetical protein